MHARDDFEDFVAARYPALLRTAYLLTGHRADAEDLLQDTMLSAFKGYGSLRPDSHLKSWLMTIMRNIWIDGHRVASRRPVETTLDDTVDSQTTSAALATLVRPHLTDLADRPGRQPVLACPPDTRCTTWCRRKAPMRSRSATIRG